jgi:hypothetical protein
MLIVQRPWRMNSNLCGRGTKPDLPLHYLPYRVKALNIIERGKKKLSED